MDSRSRQKGRSRKDFSNINILKVIISIILGLIIVAQAERIAEGLTFIFENVADFNTELTKTIITQIGLALITYTLIDSIFTVRKNKEISKRIDDLASKLGENIEKLQYSVGITQGALDTGLSAVKATRSDAIKGIREKMNEVISKCNEHNKQKFKIKILGISLGDYLCPHGPLYHEFRDIINMPNVTLQILILRDGSYSAIQRAKIEEQYVFMKAKADLSGTKASEDQDETKTREEQGKAQDSKALDCQKYKTEVTGKIPNCEFGNVKSSVNIDAVDCYSYLQTKCHNELRTATIYLYNLCMNKQRIKRDFDEKCREDKSEQTELLKEKLEDCNKKLEEMLKKNQDKDENNQEKDENKLQEEYDNWSNKWENIKSYDYAPLLLMIEFDDTMFVENYHLASRGGESPVLQIRKGTNLFRIYDDHFDMLFKDTDLSGPIDCSLQNKTPCLGKKSIRQTQEETVNKENKARKTSTNSPSPSKK